MRGGKCTSSVQDSRSTVPRAPSCRSSGFSARQVRVLLVSSSRGEMVRLLVLVLPSSDEGEKIFPEML